jgi:hypothetical protein
VNAACRALAASLVAAALLPLLFLALDSAGEWADISVDDLLFAYMLAAPVGLGTALLLAWPAYRLSPARWTGEGRLLFTIVICIIGPVLIFFPTAGEFPWKAGLAGGASGIIWILTVRFLERRSPGTSLNRSKPSG